MKYYILILAFAVVALYYYYYIKSDKPTDTILSPQSNTNTTSGPRLVYYSMPGCGHCVKFNSEWSKLQDTGLNTLKVDCSVDTDLCVNVPHVPYIVLVDGGNSDVYTGPRTADSIGEWINSKQN